MTQSKELTQFYKDWWSWFSQDTKNTPFSNSEGLCVSLMAWTNSRNMSAKPFLDEMRDQFKDAGLCHRYPFNKGNDSHTRSMDYTKEFENNISHLNHARILWVRKHKDYIEPVNKQLITAPGQYTDLKEFCPHTVFYTVYGHMSRKAYMKKAVTVPIMNNTLRMIRGESPISTDNDPHWILTTDNKGSIGYISLKDYGVTANYNTNRMFHTEEQALAYWDKINGH